MLVPMTPPPTMTTCVSAGRRELDPIVSFVNASCVAPRILPIPTRFRKAIRTQAAHVFRWLFLKQRFDEQPADSRGAANAMRVAPAGHHEPFQTRTFANDETPVRRERRPAFADPRFIGATRLWQKARELF